MLAHKAQAPPMPPPFSSLSVSLFSLHPLLTLGLHCIAISTRQASNGSGFPSNAFKHRANGYPLRQFKLKQMSNCESSKHLFFSNASKYHLKHLNLVKQILKQASHQLCDIFLNKILITFNKNAV